jgi:probable HAF family extracellular repeat protein
MSVFTMLRRPGGHRATTLGAAVGLSLVALAVTGALVTAQGSADSVSDSSPASESQRMELAGLTATSDTPPREPPPASDPGGFLYRPGVPGRDVFIRLNDVPGATLTVHLAINDRQVTGLYVDAPNPDGTYSASHGFVQDRRGRTVGFDVFGASITLPNGINDGGDIAGVSVDAGIPPGAQAPPGSVHGFIRDRRGDIDSFDVPFFRLHNVSDINNRGQIVGYYDDAGFAGGGGFLRDPNGHITDIRYPGAPFTNVHSINDHGQAVGAYLEPGAAPNPDGTIPRGTVHGFVWEDGQFRTIDVPGATYTQAFGINNRGQIVGGYRDSAGNQHGFLHDGRRYRTLDVPGGGGNAATGINERGFAVLPDSRAAGTLPVAP